MRTRTLILAAVCVLSPAGISAQEEKKETHWCAPELERMSESMCSYAPPGDAPANTLVIFLHGVIKPETTWQYSQQRFLVRAARASGFATLTPRGRRGVGPGNMKDWWTWPTSHRAQQQVEAELIAEWRDARQKLEERRGKPFDRVWVMGFSNGAYYGASLALRGALPEVNGYGIYAGGGGKYLERPGRAVPEKHRVPIYVGYGRRDKAASKDSPAFARMLRQLGWKHRLVPRKNVGHSMTDAQLKEAVTYLRKAKTSR